MFADLNTTANAPNFTTCLRGKQLLQEPAYRDAWKAFREQVPLGDFDFEQYYTATLMSFAEYVQTIPATRHVFYSHPGGLFQLGLDRAIVSTKLALKAYKDFEGRDPEDLTAYELAELFAVFSAALLSDLGLLTLRFQIRVADETDTVRSYDPYKGSILTQGRAFAFEFRNPELSDWSAPASLVLAQRLLSQTQPDYRDSGFAWISRHHDILQLWYSMLLELTPVNEGTTRRRYLTTLIPSTESDIIQDFLLNIHNNGLLLPSKQNRTLFTPQDLDHENLKESVLPGAEMTDPVRRARGEFEKVFGGMGAADASNSQVLGSLGAGLAPQLRYGLAFLGWLMTMARAGRLWSGADAPMAFGLGGGNIAFDVKALLQAFSKETNLPKISAQDLLAALKEIQIVKSQNISLRQFAWGNDKTKSFDGLVLPGNFVLGDVPGPKIELGLNEITSATAANKNDTLKAAKNFAFAMFQNKPMF